MTKTIYITQQIIMSETAEVSLPDWYDASKHYYKVDEREYLVEVFDADNNKVWTSGDFEWKSNEDGERHGDLKIEM